MSQSLASESSARATTPDSTQQMFGVSLADSAGPSVEQLGRAFNELCQAVSYALQDERDVAEQFIQRAATLLNVNLMPVVADLADSGDTDAGRVSGRTFLAPWQERKVKSYIEENLASPLSIRQIAASVDRSVSYFSRSFRYTVGESPHRYVQRRRIERAQGMMLQTTKPLADIAVECGLADQAHLGKLFRKLVGESPGAWRRARDDAP